MIDTRRQAVARRKNLEALRTSKGFDNRSAFARAVGVSREQTWKWERGLQGMSADACRRVAEVLGVDMETVLRAVAVER